MKSFFHHDLFRWNLQYAYFRGKDHVAVTGDIITGWTQTVAIQNSAYQITITEHDRCRAIPWLHHGCVVLIEISLVLGHGHVVSPWFRNQDHHSQCHIHTAHDQEFQCIIQHGRVRTGCIDHRKDLVEVFFQIWGSHGLFSGQHLICISTDSVDLTIVHNKAVWMCTFPAWIRIGTESGMYRCNGRFIVRALQIFEKGAQLPYQKHTFVYNGTAGT